MKDTGYRITDESIEQFREYLIENERSDATIQKYIHEIVCLADDSNAYEFELSRVWRSWHPLLWKKAPGSRQIVGQVRNPGMKRELRTAARSEIIRRFMI